MAQAFDVVVIGAGAAGMMAAAVAGQRGARVALVDHASRLAEKIRISGGGRCNFTNLHAGPANFISQNPKFCRSALAAYGPRDFIALVDQYGIVWHEKHRGQLFCDDSAEDIIAMLRAECMRGRVSWLMPCTVSGIARAATGYRVLTGQGEVAAPRVVLATGGMAIPQLGATDFALGIARQFGLKVVEPRPALVPLTFDAQQWQPYSALAGVAVEVGVEVGVGVGADSKSDATARAAAGSSRRKGEAAVRFIEDLLFTHRGLSGPAILQISSFWNPGRSLVVDLAPERDLADALSAMKAGSRQRLGTVLAGLWPKRLAERWLQDAMPGEAGLADMRLADVPDRLLRKLAQDIHAWTLTPTGTAGYKKAEVMRGGVDTRELNQKTMEAAKAPGLYFIGEAVDVTGWLGGYNFQWAWASGVACGKAVSDASSTCAA